MRMVAVAGGQNFNKGQLLREGTIGERLPHFMNYDEGPR